MLILRPTRKVLNIARIKPAASEEFLSQNEILNEWFVDIAGLGSPGKTVLLFVHRTTYLTVMVPGRSLLKSIPVFVSRLEKLLIRHKVSKQTTRKIIEAMDPVVICKTNDRKTLGIINQRKYELFVLFQVRFEIDHFSDWDMLEDQKAVYLNKPREGKGYTWPLDELRNILIDRG